MTSIQDTMMHDHKRCDHLFAEAEQQAANQHWSDAMSLVQQFSDALLNHLSFEENTLFPAFEDKTGMTQGPTMMMRHEHEQMRELVNELIQAASDQNQERYLGLSESLLIYMQQHNMKEEQILYPMIDQECADEADQLLSGLYTNTKTNAA